ncbi:MAG: hypothetical protein J5I67_01145 [Ignavibacterium album]|nr:hypothetical protein [Ignavibacterium album]
MKNIMIYLIVILIIDSYQNTYSQNKELLTEKALIMLNDSSLTIQQGALFNIIGYDLIDTRDYLEENFWDIARSNQSLALRVLLHLNSNLTNNYAYRLIDTLEQNPYDQSKYFEAYQSGPFVPEELVEIADVLFSFGDFSKENYVFELAQVYSINEFSSKFIKPLSKMAKNSPTNSAIAKDLLINIIYNAEDEYYRNDAVINLEAAIGSEIVPVLIQAYQVDSSSTNRFYLLNEYLSKYHDEFNADSLLKAFLLIENDKEIRLHISKILLYGLGSISNYLFVKEYLNDETDEAIRAIMEFEIEEGVPALFNDNSTIRVCIDTVISITNQVFILSWLGDLTLSNDLKNILTTAKIDLQNGDSLACRVQVKAFQDLVDNVYKDSLNTDQRFVTIEGWEFLYWNAQYILDRLPKP